MIKEIKGLWEYIDNNRKKWFIALLVVYTVLFYCFIYNDILETIRMGMAVWEELFAGRLRYLYGGEYHVTAYAYTKDVHGVYEFPIYILFGLWSLPLYLLDSFTTLDVFNNVLCLMWMKTLVLLFVLLLLTAVNKLIRTMGLEEDKCYTVDILFLTSTFFMTSIVIDSAYDIVALYFAILGIEAWMRDDRKRFVMFFMMSIPLKFFSLLIFIPLLLLKEKNILKIIGGVCMSVLPILVFRLLIPCSGAGGSFALTDMLKGPSLGNLALYYAITNYTYMALGETYYSVIGWLALFIICYMIKLEDEDQMYKAGIYVCFMSYLILFITCYTHPYWHLIILPFMYILIVMHQEYIHISLILELAASVCMIGAQIVEFPWCFGNAPVSGMLLSLFAHNPDKFVQCNPITVVTGIAGSEAARKLSVGAGGMGGTVFITCMVIFALVNFPKEFGWKKYIRRRGEIAESWVMPVRIVSSLVIGMIPILFYIMGLAR